MIDYKPKLGPPPDWFTTRTSSASSASPQTSPEENKENSSETESSIESIKKEIEEIYEMIREADVYLHEHKSNVVETIHNELQQFSQSSAAIKLGARLPDIMQKSDPKKVLIGGVAVGAGYLGALIYDGVKNTMTELKIEQKKDAFYRELEVKYKALIEKQDKILSQLKHDNIELTEERAALKKEFSDIHVLCSRIKSYLKQSGVA